MEAGTMTRGEWPTVDEADAKSEKLPDPAPATSEKKKRDRKPQYIVFRELADGRYERINADPITAATRKEAVELATAKDSEDAKQGSFMVLQAKDMWTKTRSSAVKTIDTWE